MISPNSLGPSFQSLDVRRVDLPECFAGRIEPLELMKYRDVGHGIANTAEQSGHLPPYLRVVAALFQNLFRLLLSGRSVFGVSLNLRRVDVLTYLITQRRRDRPGPSSLWFSLCFVDPPRGTGPLLLSS